MFNATAAFSGFSNNDKAKAKQFYVQTLGLKLVDDRMGLNFDLPGGGRLFIYHKDNHEPATFTVLNLVVDDIDEAVDQLIAKGVELEIYDGLGQDAKGIARSTSPDDGPTIAWFKDPAGNILAVLENGFTDK